MTPLAQEATREARPGVGVREQSPERAPEGKPLEGLVGALAGRVEAQAPRARALGTRALEEATRAERARRQAPLGTREAVVARLAVRC